MSKLPDTDGFALDAILIFTELHGSDTWRILHNLNQPVIIAITDMLGNFIWEGDFTEDLNESIIKFRRPISGKAYIRLIKSAKDGVTT